MELLQLLWSITSTRLHLSIITNSAFWQGKEERFAVSVAKQLKYELLQFLYFSGMMCIGGFLLPWWEAVLMKLHCIASTILRLVSRLIPPCGVPVQNQRHLGFFVSLWISIKNHITAVCVFTRHEIGHIFSFVWTKVTCCALVILCAVINVYCYLVYFLWSIFSQQILLMVMLSNYWHLKNFLSSEGVWKRWRAGRLKCV